MALAAFLLVTTEDDEKEVREVGYIYLVATRIGTLCLFAMFAALFSLRGELRTWRGRLDARHALAVAVFVLGFVGFGLKAGVMPLHVWLPGAHANAPSHVSAMMSGVLIKMGIYGLVRVTSLFPSPPPWWGGVVARARASSRACSASPSRSASTTSSGCSPTTASRTSASSAWASASRLLGRALGRPELGRARPRRRAAARLEPWPVQGAAVPQRRLGHPRDRHARDRPAGRARQADAVDGGSRSWSARSPSAACRR